MHPIEQLYQTYLTSRAVTTDSRAISPGCIFFAFKGEHFDGNAFAPKALEQGAALCVIDNPVYKIDERCIVVSDVLATLQELARHHRRHLMIPVIGITGTNGKTTTKELVNAVLSKRYRTAATKGNFNNHLGVPLTLLSIPKETEIAIVEMGANHPGEIEFLCGIADPDCGLITNVGRAHLEGFGGFEGVVKTKTELYLHLAAKQGFVFVNRDNGRLMQESEGMRRITYGRTAEADVRGTLVGCDPYLHFYFEVGDNVYNVHSHLLGAYNFDNAMAAVAVGLHFGVEPFDIKEAIEEYTPSNNRSQFKRTGRNTLYLDCYNANPSSMAVAIESFGQLQAGRKVAIIGGMHELGADEQKEHRQLVAELEAIHPERCLLVGPEFDSIELPTYMQHFTDTDAVKAYLTANPICGATVLVKGSNTNRLWTLEEVL
jgi:UDP-N-acetylmuramoyl-tripeptide--D-alanyl-D-alanine ligase